jgi:hypothetical protein
MKAVRDYIERDPDTQRRRSLACGIVFGRAAIAINVRQLAVLLCKCRTLINASLKQIGYATKPVGQGIDRETRQLIPVQDGDHSGLKKWTIRLREQWGEPESAEPINGSGILFPIPAKCGYESGDIVQVKTEELRL